MDYNIMDNNNMDTNLQLQEMLHMKRTLEFHSHQLLYMNSRITVLESENAALKNTLTQMGNKLDLQETHHKEAISAMEIKHDEQVIAIEKKFDKYIKDQSEKYDEELKEAKERIRQLESATKPQANTTFFKDKKPDTKTRYRKTQVDNNTPFNQELSRAVSSHSKEEQLQLFGSCLYNALAKPDNSKSNEDQPTNSPSKETTQKLPVYSIQQVFTTHNESTKRNQQNYQSNYNVVVPNDSDLINGIKDNSPLLKELMDEFNFNPRDFDINTKNAKFFVIKSYSEDDVFRSIKHSIWTSTEHGNHKLNEAFSSQESNGIMAPIYLFFSVHKSGHFCGVAEMKSNVEFDVKTGIFEQAKWKGRFDVRWIYVKDVPNKTFKHILVESNENKQIFFSRDTQEIPENEGIEVLKIIHNYKDKTSLLDDFSHYENREANQRGRRK